MPQRGSKPPVDPLSQAIEKLEMLAGYDYHCMAGRLIQCQDFIDALALLRTVRNDRAAYLNSSHPP